jgi:ABC-type polysaccharide/polyol phosphate export permease
MKMNTITEIGIFAITGMAQAFVLGVSFNSDILSKFLNWVGYISLFCGILTIVHKINLVEKQFPLDNLLYSGIITFIFVTWMVSWLLGYYMRKSKI